MIKVLGGIKDIGAVAVSGGADSVGALEFMLRGKHKPAVVHFNHGTAHGRVAEDFVTDYCASHSLEVVVGSVRGSKPRRESWEEWWRNQRYSFFRSLPLKIATAHTLDDVAETWLMGSLHGRPRLIPYRNRNVVRPFLLAQKEELRALARAFVEDEGNSDSRYDRVKIRKLMPSLLEINPGYLTVIAKQVRAAGLE